MPQQSSDDDGISELPTPSGPDVKHAQCGTNSSMSSHPTPSPNSANGGPPQDPCNLSRSPMSPHLPHLPPHHHPPPGLHPGPGGPTDLHHPGEVPTGALYAPTGPPHALSDPFFLFYFFPVLFCSVFFGDQLIDSNLVGLCVLCAACCMAASSFPFLFDSPFSPMLSFPTMWVVVLARFLPSLFHLPLFFSFFYTVCYNNCSSTLKIESRFLYISRVLS